jgi:hypothetical protein
VTACASRVLPFLVIQNAFTGVLLILRQWRDRTRNVTEPSSRLPCN